MSRDTFLFFRNFNRIVSSYRRERRHLNASFNSLQLNMKVWKHNSMTMKPILRYVNYFTCII